ncbi:MAG: TetR/AcrR family transcriptional regulator [Chloroflexi bacterium]|nr:TetR/AcrR family transcriptional regulator [Chloroflexota bacterium]
MSRKKNITDVAANLFASRGYHATSIQDLSEELGLGKGSLYYHIGSKDELLFWVHEQFINPLLKETEEILARGLPPAETLRAISHNLMRVITEYLPFVTVFYQDHRALSDGRREQILEKQDSFERIIDSVLQRGIDEGTFLALDVPVTRLAFLGMHNHAYHWLHPDGRVKPEEIADIFCALFLQGIEKR